MTAEAQKPSRGNKKLPVSLLSLAHTAQQEHGLRQENYQRYQRYCVGQIQSFRKRCEWRHGNGKRVQWKSLNEYEWKTSSTENGESAVAEETASVRSRSRSPAKKDLSLSTKLPKQVYATEYLLMVFWEAERQWATAMHLKTAGEETANGKNARRALQKFKKAVEYARILENAAEKADFQCSTTSSQYCPALWVAESKIYLDHMQGLLEFELQRDWRKCLSSFAQSRHLILALCDVHEVRTNPVLLTLYHQRVEQLVPMIRYCAYNLAQAKSGIPSDVKTLDDILALHWKSESFADHITFLLKALDKATTDLPKNASLLNDGFKLMWFEQEVVVKDFPELQELFVTSSKLWSSLKQNAEDWTKWEKFAHAARALENAVESLVSQTTDALKQVQSQHGLAQLETLKNARCSIKVWLAQAEIERNLILARLVLKALHQKEPFNRACYFKIFDPMSKNQKLPVFVGRPNIGVLASIYGSAANMLETLVDADGINEDPSFHLDAQDVILFMNSLKCYFMGLENAQTNSTEVCRFLLEKSFDYVVKAERAHKAALNQHAIFQSFRTLLNISEPGLKTAKIDFIAKALCFSYIPTNSIYSLLGSGTKVYPQYHVRVGDRKRNEKQPFVLQPVPLKPIFFDIAYGQIMDNVPVEQLRRLSEGKEETSATTKGIVGGLLGSFWSR